MNWRCRSSFEGIEDEEESKAAQLKVDIRKAQHEWTDLVASSGCSALLEAA